jgi:hypothetical protein
MGRAGNDDSAFDVTTLPLNEEFQLWMKVRGIDADSLSMRQSQEFADEWLFVSESDASFEISDDFARHLKLTRGIEDTSALGYREIMGHAEGWETLDEYVAREDSRIAEAMSRNKELSDLGVPRPPVVMTAEAKEWDSRNDREARLREAERQARQAIEGLARELAIKETIPRGSYVDRPHSEYVAARTPDFVALIVRSLANDVKTEARHATDATGREVKIATVGDFRHQVVAISNEKGLTIGDFPLEDFKGGRREIEELWLQHGDWMKVAEHALPNTQTARTREFHRGRST